MTRSKTCQSFEAYLTFNMKAFNLRLSTIVVYHWPASLKFTTVDERDNPRLVYDQPEKVLFPPFPCSSKHSHFVCHFGEIPKGVTSRVHYYSIQAYLTLHMKDFQPQRQMSTTVVYDGQPASNSQQWMNRTIPDYSLKKSLSPFHVIVNTATLFVTLVKFPKA